MKYLASGRQPKGLSATAAGTTNAKIITQARQGLQRLEVIEQEQRQRAIAQAADPSNAELGLLVLEPVASEIRTVAAQKFAQIMQIDPCTATATLSGLAVPAMVENCAFRSKAALSWGSLLLGNLAEIQKIRVFQVSYFQTTSPPVVVCENEQGQLGSLRFNWSEVSQRVAGLLPILKKLWTSTCVVS